MESFLNELTGSLKEILYVVVIAAVSYGTVLIRSHIKKIEDKNLAEALDRAVTNAAGEVINKLGSKAVTEEVKASDPAVVTAAADIPKSNPDGVKQFGLDAKDLQEKVTKKVGVLTAPAVASEVKK